MYCKEKRRSQAHPYSPDYDPENDPHSTELTTIANRQANRDEAPLEYADADAGRVPAVDGATGPILANRRVASYGSCEETVSDDPPRTKSNRVGLRHQIGSEVFDFGDSSIWPGPVGSKPPKRPSKKAVSWLRFSDTCNKSEGTLQRRSSLFASTDVDCNVSFHVAAVPGENKPPKGDEKSKVNTVFTLFGLDNTRKKEADTDQIELSDLGSNSTRPRANAISAPNPKAEECRNGSAHDLPAWIQTDEGPRKVSLNKYLDEIAKIGANGSQRASHPQTSQPVLLRHQPSPSAFQTPKARVLNKAKGKENEAASLVDKMQAEHPAHQEAAPTQRVGFARNLSNLHATPSTANVPTNNTSPSQRVLGPLTNKDKQPSPMRSKSATKPEASTSCPAPTKSAGKGTSKVAPTSSPERAKSSASQASKEHAARRAWKTTSTLTATGARN